MSECTTCSYYGKHLDGRAEDMPWPCVECAGGEKYVERGKRKHRVPLRVQLAALLARHNALVEAVKWMLYIDTPENFEGGKHIKARAELERLLSEEKK